MAVLLCFRVPGNESQPGSCCTVDSEPQKLPFPPSFQPPPPPPLPTLPLLIQPQHARCLRPLLPSAHQPGVSGCFLFHVRVIPTGPRPNESFPPRYGEKITLRVRSERSMRHKRSLTTLWRSRGLRTCARAGEAVTHAHNSARHDGDTPTLRCRLSSPGSFVFGFTEPQT